MLEKSDHTATGAVTGSPNGESSWPSYASTSASALNLEDSGLVAFDKFLHQAERLLALRDDRRRLRRKSPAAASNMMMAGGLSPEAVTEIAIDIGGDFGARNVIICRPRHRRQRARQQPAEVLGSGARRQGRDQRPGPRHLKSRPEFVACVRRRYPSGGEYNAAVITDCGDNDVFITGDGSYTLIGDVAFVGGGVRLEVHPGAEGHRYATADPRRVW